MTTKKINMVNSTIKRKTGKCKNPECNYTGVLYAKGYCQSCYWKHRSKIKKDTIRTYPLTPKDCYKPTGEKAIFDIVYKKQNGRCFITGKFLKYEDVKASSFMHLLSKAKNKYPLFKLYDRNIIMVIPRIHELYDFGTKDKLYSEFRSQSKELDKMYKLIAELKKEYNN